MEPSAKGLQDEPVPIEKSSLPSPVLTYLPGRIWRLEQPYRYEDKGESGNEETHRVITVPAGFEFDLSSVPRVFWSVVAPFDLSIVAPLLHDFLYRYAGAPPDGAVDPPKVYSRLETDQLFRRIMEQEGVPPWRRTLGYWAVRLFGRVAWKGR
jgi:hypothetical protein